MPVYLLQRDHSREVELYRSSLVSRVRMLPARSLLRDRTQRRPNSAALSVLRVSQQR